MTFFSFLPFLWIGLYCRYALVSTQLEEGGGVLSGLVSSPFNLLATFVCFAPALVVMPLSFLEGFTGLSRSFESRKLVERVLLFLIWRLLLVHLLGPLHTDDLLAWALWWSVPLSMILSLGFLKDRVNRPTSRSLANGGSGMVRVCVCDLGTHLSRRWIRVQRFVGIRGQQDGNQGAADRERETPLPSLWTTFNRLSASLTSECLVWTLPFWILWVVVVAPLGIEVERSVPSRAFKFVIRREVLIVLLDLLEVTTKGIFAFSGVLKPGAKEEALLYVESVSGLGFCVLTGIQDILLLADMPRLFGVVVLAIEGRLLLLVWKGVNHVLSIRSHRRAKEYLETRLPKAPLHVLSEQPLCVICREEMGVFSAASEGDSSSSSSTAATTSSVGQPLLLRCNHAFHSHCIRSWVNTVVGGGGGGTRIPGRGGEGEGEREGVRVGTGGGGGGGSSTAPCSSRSFRLGALEGERRERERGREGRRTLLRSLQSSPRLPNQGSDVPSAVPRLSFARSSRHLAEGGGGGMQGQGGSPLPLSGDSSKFSSSASSSSSRPFFPSPTALAKEKGPVEKEGEREVERESVRKSGSGSSRGSILFDFGVRGRELGEGEAGSEGKDEKIVSQEKTKESGGDLTSASDAKESWEVREERLREALARERERVFGPSDPFGSAVFSSNYGQRAFLEDRPLLSPFPLPHAQGGGGNSSSSSSSSSSSDVGGGGKHTGGLTRNGDIHGKRGIRLSDIQQALHTSKSGNKGAAAAHKGSAAASSLLFLFQVRP
uniref:RING-type domain-containing protein n=1 Tax=Chromera velia CCMP2878 TaxID=1169474 RepID=A0A0G4G3T9_9ALVE|eukprot:Cvel_20151.t1-p1 / transcript=Cvel_20151.t1 / gene=Cvel_20151 / organism=Chromera_velia_CCMP2878 / gene_product=hypothetical protein / transcript_product=hypothetical protein / location=Cvel_scaffold1789:13140-25924(+) / protein_length=771 / sequence_SO=supercontig / SO=protein_coding / is_pseudo=false